MSDEKYVSIWRHASRQPTIFGVPAMAYIPLFICLLHLSWLTFYIAIATIAVFGILRGVFNITFIMMRKRILHWIRGSHIKARPWWYRKYYQGIRNNRRGR